MFIGRESELQELNMLYKKQTFQMFVLYGRRRVGKTTLLNEFCKDKPSIFYAAEQTNDKMNLEKFSRLVFEYYKETNLENFSSWDRAIGYINEKQQDEQLVLVFDEFPYLANVNPGLMSILQHLIDHKLLGSKLFIILCGSYMGFMEKEVLGAKSPLFGRRTAQLQMKPFDYSLSSAFYRNRKLDEKAIFYSIFGGTPLYLSQIDEKESLETNVKRLFLKPTGYLYEEPQLLLQQEVQEPGVYLAIIEAIAKGAVRSSEIASKTGEDNAKCIKYAAVLCELGIIYKEYPLGAKQNSRKGQYRICDPMFAFWYRYVAPNRTLIETGASQIVWTRRIENDMSDYVGFMFERICKEYLYFENSKGNLPILATDIGRWWGTDSKKKTEVEIDLVARDDKTYIFGECKWRNEKLGYSVLEQLRYKSDVMDAHRGESWYYLFSKSGFSDAIIEESKRDEHVVLVTLETLYSNRKP